MCSSMADTDSNIKPPKLVSEHNQENPSKFYYNFLYKAVAVVIFLVILPLFPSQAPEFINQTVFTRSWELLHLLFVGIAISYGLFSRRSDETEKENNNSNNSKFDNAQSYVSRFLQVSSVFEDEAESPSGSDENKVQTWNNQYFRNEPMVVVAQEHAVVNEQRATSSRIGEKPLLLPVRSLKSLVSDPDVVESFNESSGSSSASLSRSNSKSGSKRFSSNSKKDLTGELGGLDHMKLEEKLKENVVLPSPIPWRSRSGRMEMKEEVENPPLHTLPPSMEEFDFSKLESRLSRSQLSHSSRSNSTSSSPKLSPSPSLASPRKLSSSPPLSSESQSKNAEDYVRKKSFYKSSPPPPPPPPPPPQMVHKSNSMKPRSSSMDDRDSYVKDFRRSFTDERKDVNWSGGDNLQGRVEGTTMAKSVRTIRGGETLGGPWRGTEIGEDAINGTVEKNPMEGEETFVGKSARKTMGYNQMSLRTDKLIGRGNVSFLSKPTFQGIPEDEKVDFIESDNETESENDEIGESLIKKDIGRSSKNDDIAASSSVGDEGPDVDKKADEFIAKFREQIRLQRIESIKKSSAQFAQFSRSSPR